MYCIFQPTVHTGLRLEKSETQPSVFMWTVNPHTFRNDDAIAPPLDPWTPRRLIATTTTMAAYMFVFVPQKTTLPVHTKDSGFLASAIFIFFFLLCSVSPSTVCLQRASLMRMLSVFFSVFGECQAPPVGWNMNCSVVGRCQSIHVDANILKTMMRKMEGKRLFTPVWTEPESGEQEKHWAAVNGPDKHTVCSHHVC